MSQSLEIIFPQDEQDLHQAVERLPEGGILRILPGVHEISEPLAIDKNIQIIGSPDAPQSVVIESRGEGVLKITAADAHIQGLTLLVKAGIEMDIQGQTFLIKTRKENEEILSRISQCRNSSDSDTLVDGLALFALYDRARVAVSKTEYLVAHSVVVMSAGNSLISQCRISSDSGCGVIFADDSKGRLYHCDLFENADDGIVLNGTADPTVRECKIHDGKNTGIDIRETAKGTFEKCEVSENDSFGIYVDDTAAPTVCMCKIYDGKRSGIYVTNMAKGTFEKCDVYGNESDGIALYGNSDPAIRDCKFRNDKRIGIVVANTAKGTFENCEVHGNDSVGILVYDTADPTVRMCKIRDCKRSGISVHDTAKGTFEKCEVYGNEDAGICVLDTAAPTVRLCKIYDGKGAGLFVADTAKGTFEQCEVFGNEGGGIDDSGGKATLKNCVLNGNGLTAAEQLEKQAATGPQVDELSHFVFHLQRSFTIKWSFWVFMLLIIFSFNDQREIWMEPLLEAFGLHGVKEYSTLAAGLIMLFIFSFLCIGGAYIDRLMERLNVYAQWLMCGIIFLFACKVCYAAVMDGTCWVILSPLALVFTYYLIFGIVAFFAGFLLPVPMILCTIFTNKPVPRGERTAKIDLSRR